MKAEALAKLTERATTTKKKNDSISNDSEKKRSVNNCSMLCFQRMDNSAIDNSAKKTDEDNFNDKYMINNEECNNI